MDITRLVDDMSRSCP